jgi:hypothetical protein
MSISNKERQIASILRQARRQHEWVADVKSRSDAKLNQLKNSLMALGLPEDRASALCDDAGTITERSADPVTWANQLAATVIQYETYAGDD